MILLGVDPGGRDTGLAVVDTSLTGKVPTLLASVTITRPKDGTDLLDLSAGRAYLIDVLGGIIAAAKDYPIEALAVEGISRPNSHHRGKVAITDPTAILATALVAGAIVGRQWSFPLVTVPPKGNGMLLPPTSYPEAIRPKSIAGKDKRRHERSAYDVAMMGAPEIVRALNRRERTKPHA